MSPLPSPPACQSEISRIKKGKSKPTSSVMPTIETTVMFRRDVRPSPENDKLYKPVDPRSPDIRELAESIRERGVLEPIVVTLDGYIVSGHRRYAASRVARLNTIPVRVLPIRRADDLDEFVRLLREHNRQREKSLDEKVREAVIDIDPVEAHARLQAHRKSKSDKSSFGDEAFKIVGEKTRAGISPALQPFLRAIIAAIESRRAFWPLSVRQIHYALLNNPPLKHASKPHSIYANDRASYQTLTDLATRARLTGQIPWHAISDDTRPHTTWRVHDDPGTFVREEVQDFLRGYARNLMRSQPNHIEIVGEKLTVKRIIDDVASEYTIPVTIGRGYSSITPRRDMAERFRLSGKSNLIVLMLSDFDPDGEEIAQSFARSMRDDFGVSSLVPVKVALTADHVEVYDLPPNMLAKASSSNHAKFVAAHGTHAYELEALPPETLQDILRGAIDRVIDTEAFNAELNAERSDAANLESWRRTVATGLGTLGRRNENDGNEWDA